MSEFQLCEFNKEHKVEGVRELSHGMGGTVEVILGRAVPKDTSHDIIVEIVQADEHRTRQQLKAQIIRPFFQLKMWHGMITFIDIDFELMKTKNERVRLSDYGKYIADRAFYHCSWTAIFGSSKYVTFIFDDKLKVCNQIFKLPDNRLLNSLQVEFDFSEVTDKKLLETLYRSVYSNGNELRNFDAVYDDPVRKAKMINKCSTRGFFKQLGWTALKFVLIPVLFPIFLVSGVYIFFKYPKWDGKF